MGERFYIGSNLAVIEMMMCLGMILKTFDIQKVDNQKAQMDVSIYLRMKHGLKLVLIEKSI
ncbi:hypothetical protein [Marinicellulosiphila megalodicopiae]|uniref:hypothetical protein n=1 Tax=Marinicellulosiphila megalodicopiae TaxID=2724896 RepID=UPI003BAF443F